MIKRSCLVRKGRRHFLSMCGVVLISLILTSCQQPIQTTPTPLSTSTQTPTATAGIPKSTVSPAPTLTEVSSTPKPIQNIELINPNGNEEWVEGETYYIQWRSTGVEKINIAVATGGKDLGHIAFDLDAKTGEYEWTIPQGFISDFGPSVSDTMRIRIYAPDHAEVYDENDAHFTISAPSG